MEPTVNYLVHIYAFYFAAAVVLTIWLARTLFASGETFLTEVFADNQAMARAVNRLLVVGFYLLNLGYALVWMKASGAATTFEAIEVLAYKLGSLLLVLGALHFANLYLFHRIRQRNRMVDMPPPVNPHMSVRRTGSGVTMS